MASDEIDYSTVAINKNTIMVAPVQKPVPMFLKFLNLLDEK